MSAISKRLMEMKSRAGSRKLQRFMQTPFNHQKKPSNDNFGPYKWQLEFFEAINPTRGIMAGNRCGKTQTAAMEIAIHCTGMYPDWWVGKRFNHPVDVWTGCETNELSRDVVQNALLGEEGSHGTGWIPKDSIIGVKYRQAGVPDVADVIKVKHSSGGTSIVKLKTYEQGRKKWQGTSKHLVWLDEEPSWEVFSEAKTRTLDKKGLLLLTFTPLSGSTGVVDFLLNEDSPAFMKNVTWDDCPHLDEGAKKELSETYQDWERDTREKGIPMLGSGAVFKIDDNDIKIEPFEIPYHFAQLCGIDFGIDHPGSAVWLAHDRDRDIVYVTDCYRKSGQDALYHSEAIKTRGRWIPCSWPHDGMNRDKGNAQPLYKAFKKKGVKMLRRSSRYQEDKGGPQAVEPVIIDMLERMKTGRFRVFSNLDLWFEEKRMYHRKDGKIVDKKDDIMAATRVGMMDLRKARVKIETTSYQSGPTSPILGRLHVN